MTDEQKILNESEVAEIEAANKMEGGLVISPEIDALCQTVRALESALRKANEIVEEAARQDLALRAQLAQADMRIAELERRLRIPFGRLPCALCGGPHDFDTSLPSVAWNRIIRAKGLPDYLCTTCIVREFVRVGQGFTAELWNEEFSGVPIEVVINGQNGKDASLMQEENNLLRNQLNDAAQSVVNEAEKVGQLMRTAATAMRAACVGKVREMRDEWQQKHSELNSDAELIDRLVLEGDMRVADEIITELESLTPDQVEQKQ